MCMYVNQAHDECHWKPEIPPGIWATDAIEPTTVFWEPNSGYCKTNKVS